MPQVRYLGFSVGEAGADHARSDEALGRFVALPEPLPVGTELELAGERLRGTRVDEAAGGFWAMPTGQRVATPAPEPVAAERTVPSAPPVEMTAQPSPPAEAAEADAEDAAPQPVPEGGDTSGRGKRKRRNRKTVLGR